MTKSLPECSMAPIGQAQAPRRECRTSSGYGAWRAASRTPSIKAFSETDFKARRKFTIRVDLMVSELPNQDEINADLLEF
jgi:hypothetical protein